MLAFWLIAVAMVLLALALVIPPLLKRHSDDDINRSDQNIVSARDRLLELQRELDEGLITQREFDQAKSELEISLHADLQQENSASNVNKFDGRWISLVVTILIPAFAGGMYLYLGTPSAITVEKQQAPDPHKNQAGQLPDTDEIITALEARLKSTPEDARGWYLLGRSYLVTGRYRKSADAFLKVQNLVGENPDIMVQRADALAMAQGGQMTGNPAELVQRALQLKPDHPQGLWMAGKAAEEQGTYAVALAHWRKLLPQLSEDKTSESEVRKLIANVETKMGSDTVNTQAITPPLNQSSTAQNKTSIKVSVKLSSGLSSKVDPQDTVFIFARALKGPPLPLAVVRKHAKELPFSVILDDSMAMQPAFRLSTVKEVKIGANVSKSGNAILQPGDLFGVVPSVQVGDTSVELVIDQVKN